MNRPKRSLARSALHGTLVVVAAVGLTLAFFLVLPLIQAISESLAPDTTLREVEAANLPPPPPPPPVEEEEQEPEPEEPPPDLPDEAPPLDLAQLELALDPGGFQDGWMAADFSIDLSNVVSSGGGVDELFSLADLDQKPRAVYQPQPVTDAKTRKHAPGKVVVIFIVDENGRVQSPAVQSSSDPIFDRAALVAVKKWKFEPGKRKGQSVRFRMRVPITFPKTSP